jgi:hypothetical protein
MGKVRKSKKLTVSLMVATVVGLPVDCTDRARASSTMLETNTTIESMASDHASHVAARVRVPVFPVLCLFVPSVTTPLYRTIVSQTLRPALRERGRHQDSVDHPDKSAPRAFRP